VLVNGDRITLPKGELSPLELIEVVRFFLTNSALAKDDARLGLVTQVREIVVREDPTGQRWLVIDGLRSVSRLKWRSRQR